MGDLAPGDVVFDEAGAPTSVVAATPPMLGTPVSRGALLGWDPRGRRCVASVADRRQERASVRAVSAPPSGRPTRSRGRCSVGGERNHQVPLAGPAQYPPRLDLPIEPYTLGAWLGDGTTTKAARSPAATRRSWPRSAARGTRSDGRATATTCTESAGWATPEIGATGRYRRNGSMSSRLRELGLLGRKHVPRPYLEAGIGQRMALLQGLMDTDGFVDDVAGRCEFTSTNERSRRRRRRACRRPRLPTGQVGWPGHAVRRRSRAEVPGEVHPGSPGLPGSPEAGPAEGCGRALPSLPRDRRRSRGRVGTRALHSGRVAPGDCSWCRVRSSRRTTAPSAASAS